MLFFFINIIISLRLRKPQILKHAEKVLMTEICASTLFYPKLLCCENNKDMYINQLGNNIVSSCHRRVHEHSYVFWSDLIRMVKRALLDSNRWKIRMFSLNPISFYPIENRKYHEKIQYTFLHPVILGHPVGAISFLFFLRPLYFSIF